MSFVREFIRISSIFSKFESSVLYELLASISREKYHAKHGRFVAVQDFFKLPLSNVFSSVFLYALQMIKLSQQLPRKQNHS